MIKAHTLFSFSLPSDCRPFFLQQGGTRQATYTLRARLRTHSLLLLLHTRLLWGGGVPEDI